MRRALSAAAIFVMTGVLAAGPRELPIVEDDVVREVEALIDKTPPVSDRDRSEVRKLIQRGTQAHDARRYDDALDAYRKALAIDPVNASAYYETAFTLSEMGEQAKALDQVVRSLTIDPKSEGAYVLKGNILDNLGFADAAKATYEALLAVQPSSYMGHINLGVCKVRSSDLQGAKDEMKKARDLDPKRPSAYFQLAKLAKADDCNYEEHDNLTKFLEVGKDDPRADGVRARLKEMDNVNVTIDPSDQYSTIDLAEKLSRVAWRTTEHRKRFPEACGYRPTFEEEKEILSTIVIPEWRKTKAGDAKAASGRYDLLLKIDDAGFLDEYIYGTMGSKLGEAATTWRAQHADRLKAFEDWARKEGVLNEKTDQPETANEESLAMFVVTTMSESKVHYVLDEGAAADTDKFLAAERARFRDGFNLKGDDVVDCAKADDVPSAVLSAQGAGALIPLFRCRAPGDPVLDKSVKRVSLLGLVVRDLAPSIQGGTFADKDGVHLKIVDPSWLGYVSAKSVWRNEPDVRKRYGGAESTAPSIDEEVFAMRTAAEAYDNGHNHPDEGREPFARVESLDRILEIEKAGHLRGFVLYEVLHRRYGLSLKSLSKGDAGAVTDYLMTHVLVLASKGT
ncbi:MAG TPA: tetratricopeptide repeat protein [Candidatus Polarisedimenticolaceae bacterium]|nr:tetratricopeptide repeat protein [Candidatus Polarisedimenticolaceae bacterium]